MNYLFPEVFVEDVVSEKYVVEISEDSYLLVMDGEIDRKKFKRVFGHIIYEDVLKYIDLSKNALEKTVVVVEKYGLDEMNALLVEKNTPLCILEIKGLSPYVFVHEGYSINKHDKVAYVITNKGEVRSVKSPCEGVVFLVINISWEKPEKYILMVVGRNEYRRIVVRKGSRNSL